jgi:hypothetical protein
MYQASRRKAAAGGATEEVQASSPLGSRVRLRGRRQRACFAQLQTAPDPKNKFHSKFFLPNTPNSSSSTADPLQEKGGARPQIHGFGGVPLEALHKTKFGGVGGNYPPLPLISGKNGSLLFS